MIFLSHTNHTAVDKTSLLVIVLAWYDIPLSHQPHRCGQDQFTGYSAGLIWYSSLTPTTPLWTRPVYWL